MSFAKPEMLWLLAVTAPLLAWFLAWSWRRRRALMLRFVQARLLPQLTVGVSPWRQKLRLLLAGLASVLLLLALARPQWGFAWEEVRRRGLDLVIAIDTSRSMQARDVAPDRLTRAKLATLDLMKLADADRLALVAFAGTAFLQCPLTLDDNAFQQSLNLLDVGLLPQGGTAIGPAIDAALSAFKDSGENHRALVLFTDGEDHEGDALEAARRAGKAGLKIFTVGVGTVTGDRLRLVDDEGRTTYVTDEGGQPVVSKLNLDLLREIARLTGGDFLPLMGADPMRALYDARLAALPRGDLASRPLRQYLERFQWPLGLAILLLGIELLLVERRRPGHPAAGAAAANPDLKRLFALLALGLWIPEGRASSGSAYEAWERGDYRTAGREYGRLAESDPADARLQYNAGTAALAAGNLEAATNHLGAATLARDPVLLENVHYNLGNAFYRLGEAAEAPPDMLTNWVQAVRHYESALRLNARDSDAGFNRQLVQTRIEELQRQMQQQQQQGGAPQDRQQSDEQQRKQDQQQQQQGQQQQSGQQEQARQNQESPPQEQPASSPPEGQDPREQKPQEQDGEEPEPSTGKPAGQDQQKPESKPGSGKDQDDQPQAGGTADASSGAEGTNNAAMGSMQGQPGQMTREQARQLLEAARMDEKAWQPLPARDPRKINRKYRDW